MANTPYIDLVKPAGTDKALISVINANSDKIDSAVGGVQDALAIVCNGNTHGAISSGQYVYVRAHETLQEGLYTANSNIAANAALSSSNLTANSSGGLNALNEQIVKVEDKEVTVSGYSGTTITNSSVTCHGKQVTGSVLFKLDVSQDTWKNAFQISKAPSVECFFPVIRTDNGTFIGMIKFFTNNATQVYLKNAVTVSGDTLSVVFSYKTA